MSKTNRQCGDCNVCCTTMKVTPLDKPAGTPCQHMTETGCGDYENRPEVCRVWYCMWVRDAHSILSEEERPDKLGVFFTATLPDVQTNQQALFAHEVLPGSAENPRAKAAIQRLSQYVPIQYLPARTPTTELTVDGHSISDAA